MQMVLPEKVNRIITRLKENGYDAYAVGGCVRDAVLKRIPDDWDITTSANPEDVKALFSKTIDTGIAHGTVTVLIDHEGFEVTTYRVDGIYEDCRHPKEVRFTKNLEEDLKRRDFTINAMAFNNKAGFVDIFGGSRDLENKIIRCVGDPGERFDEDALRILRAFRFSAQLGFDIEENTLKAARDRAKNLTKISAERVRVELCKLIVSDHPDRLVWMYENGITEYFIPEYKGQKLASDIISNIDKTGFGEKEYLGTALAGFIYTMSDREREALGKNILRRLKFDNDTIGITSRLLRAIELPEYELGPVETRRRMSVVGSDIMPLLFELERSILSVKGETEALLRLKKAKELFEEELKNGACVERKDLAINGRDLLEIGFENGPKIKETLSYLLERVIEDPSLNTAEKLMDLTKEQINRQI